MKRELKEIIDGVEVTDLIYPNILGSYIFQAAAEARLVDEGSGAADLDAFKQLFDKPTHSDSKPANNFLRYD